MLGHTVPTFARKLKLFWYTLLFAFTGPFILVICYLVDIVVFIFNLWTFDEKCIHRPKGLIISVDKIQKLCEICDWFIDVKNQEFKKKSKIEMNKEIYEDKNLISAKLFLHRV